MANNRTKSSNKYNAKSSSKQSGSKFMLLPLIIVIAIIPLIVRMKEYKTKLSDFLWFSSQDTTTDFFLYYKSRAFTILVILIALYLFWKVIEYKYLYPSRQSNYSRQSTNIFKDNNQYKFTYALLPLAAYAILALLSTVISKYASFGYSGIYEQFESIFVLLGYCLIVYYGFLFINTEEDVRFIMKWLMISVIILCLLGLTQATGHDFFASSLGKKLMIPSSQWFMAAGLEFKFEANRVYLSFYNPNYVGLYTALISPILMVLLLFTKNIKLQIVYVFGILGLLLCMIASSSRNGFVALCISLIFILILFRKLFMQHWKISLGVVGLIIVGFISISAYNGNAFITRLQAMFTETKTPDYSLSSIVANDDNIEITYNKNTFYIEAIPSNESVTTYNLIDSDGAPIQTLLDQATGIYSIVDSRFSTITIQQVSFEACGGFNVIIDGANWYFTNQTGDGKYYYFNAYGKFDKIVKADSALFTNYEKMGSDRGYIWSRTIPLLKNHILLGSGADTFVIEFPQNDYLGRFHNGYVEAILTKPHNIYLQMAVQTGVLSLIAFLIFYGMYFVSCIKLYISNKFDTYMSQIGVALFVGTIGYMVSGLFNDSTVTVSPIYWALMGVGLAVNYRVKLSKRSQKATS